MDSAELCSASNSEIENLERRIKNLEESNSLLKKKLRKTETVLKKEHFLGFSNLEKSYVECVNCMKCSCTSCCWFILIIVFGVVLVVYYVKHFSETTISSSETLVLVDENDDVNLFPVIFFCIEDESDYDKKRSIQEWNLLDGVRNDLRNRVSVDSFTYLQVTNSGVTIYHICIVLNWRNPTLKLSFVEGTGAPFNFQYFATTRQSVDSNLDVNPYISSFGDGQDYIQFYGNIMLGEGSSSYSFIPIWFRQGGSYFSYFRVRKRLASTLPGVPMAGLFKEEKLKDLQYEKYSQTEIYVEDQECDIEYCSQRYFLAFATDTKKYIRDVEVESGSDFLSPLVAAGGVLGSLKLIPTVFLCLLFRCGFESIYKYAVGFCSCVRNKKGKRRESIPSLPESNAFLGADSQFKNEVEPLKETLLGTNVGDEYSVNN